MATRLVTIAVKDMGQDNPEYDAAYEIFKKLLALDCIDIVGQRLQVTI